jgi:hypothetical protein
MAMTFNKKLEIWNLLDRITSVGKDGVWEYHEGWNDSNVGKEVGSSYESVMVLRKMSGKDPIRSSRRPVNRSSLAKDFSAQQHQNEKLELWDRQLSASPEPEYVPTSYEEQTRIDEAHEARSKSGKINIKKNSAMGKVKGLIIQVDRLTKAFNELASSLDSPTVPERPELESWQDNPNPDAE